VTVDRLEANYRRWMDEAEAWDRKRDARAANIKKRVQEEYVQRLAIGHELSNKSLATDQKIAIDTDPWIKDYDVLRDRALARAAAYGIGRVMNLLGG